MTTIEWLQFHLFRIISVFCSSPLFHVGPAVFCLRVNSYFKTTQMSGLKQTRSSTVSVDCRSRGSSSCSKSSTGLGLVTRSKNGVPRKRKGEIILGYLKIINTLELSNYWISDLSQVGRKSTKSTSTRINNYL